MVDGWGVRVRHGMGWDGMVWQAGRDGVGMDFR